MSTPDFGSELKRFAVHVFPGEYVGPVYVHVAAQGNEVNDVNVELLWGPLRFAIELGDVDEKGYALVCAKIKPEENPPPLRVRINAYLNITFGQGDSPLPYEYIKDCNEGWVPASS
ncbi:MAG TPA: hypothetical protein VLG40_01690 [Candidatus Saccharimonas sp.]|nr:hypothetical protein [Candidatus Saccharimonas sp.]